MTGESQSDDMGFESGSDDELVIAERDYERLHQRSLTSGYREGLSHAAEEGLQVGWLNREITDK